jgi:hypothetical protein
VSLIESTAEGTSSDCSIGLAAARSVQRKEVTSNGRGRTGRDSYLGLCQGVCVFIRVMRIYVYIRVIYVCGLKKWQIYALSAKRIYAQVLCLKAFKYAFCCVFGPVLHESSIF